ncbi:MAG: tetratricopeptide repeat protein, partial [Parabacteroides sp.]|nr:tetratricopeptide repeat protein [Parabacteroides sp.]
QGEVCFDRVADLSPEAVFESEVPVADTSKSEVYMYASSGKLLLSWLPEPDAVKEIPDPAKPALNPSDVQSTEQLYLTGLHLEQYRHATYKATDYYEEALRRDAGDVRNNNAMGLLLIRKGQFAKAEPFLRRAVKTLTERNPNPYDGEPLYNLGLSLKFQGKDDEAYEFFYKACWNAAWQDAGYYSLAQLSASKSEWSDALYEIDKSLIRNWHNHRARHLKALILRRLGRTSDALLLIKDSLALDTFNFGCLFERYLLSEKEEDLHSLHTLMRGESHNYEELALDYANAGCWAEALNVANVAIDLVADLNAIMYYYKSWFLAKLNLTEELTLSIQEAEKQDPGCFFPNRVEAILALQTVISLSQSTPKALYYLGNLWYDKRQYPEAIEAWEKSAKQDGTFQTVLRNLSLAYFNKLSKESEAKELLEKAFSLDTSDSRILMELDQLYKRLNRPHAERFSFLEQFKETAFLRDDLYLEYVTLLNQLGQYEEAIRLIDSRKFHPWEGGEGKVTAQYQLARVEMAKKYLAQGKFDEALALIEECYTYPPNLGEGKLYGAQENDFDYYKGCAMEGLNRKEEASVLFRRASVGNSQPAAAMYYNDQNPDKIFYQGLALLKLGKEVEARGRFNNLISYGEKHLYDVFKMDYFAVSLPDLQIWDDDMTKKNRIHCYYLMGLGHLGLGNRVKADNYFSDLLNLDINHIAKKFL